MNTAGNAPSNTPNTNTQSTDATAKLSAAFGPMLNGISNDIKNHVTAQIQEVQILIQSLLTRIDRLEQDKAGQRKQITKEKKPPVEATQAIKEVLVEKPTTLTNKLHWFRRMYVEDTTFREKYTPEASKKIFDTDTSFKDDKGLPKLSAMATHCWATVRDSKSPLFESFQKEFEDAKKQAEASNRSTQEVVETNTPV